MPNLVIVSWLLGWVLLWRLPRLTTPPSATPDAAAGVIAGTGVAADAGANAQADAGPGIAAGATQRAGDSAPAEAEAGAHAEAEAGADVDPPVADSSEVDSPAADSPAADSVFVSVLVPARDEVDRLPLLLTSLAAQTRPPDEVIVVDDHSSDGTGSLAAHFPDATFLAAPDLPKGWSGKTFACSTAVDASRGDVLVFLDADVVLAPDALASLLATWRDGEGLLSVQPHHVIRHPREAVSLPFNVVAMMGMGIGSLIPPRSGWGAAGPCLVTDRATYVSLGGHAGVRSEVAEDLALARRYADADQPVRCFAGRDLLQFRMYRSIAGALEGWRKNLASGARHTPILRSLAIGAWVAGLLVAAGMLVGLAGPADGPLLPLAAYVAITAQFVALARQVGRFALAPLAWPLLVLVFVGVFAWSAASTFVSRKVRWSGRTLDLRVPR